MREIVLDTETTGLDARGGDRIIEIGCLELIDRIVTGESFHYYINPEREVPAEAEAIHGISTAHLAGKPLFSEIVAEMEAFFGDDRLVIHNANFDLGFLNAEFERLGHPLIDTARAIDTLQMARRKFPGAPASLDALCKHFGIDNSARTHHGALLDAALLADVYVELVGGRQAGLNLAETAAVEPATTAARSTRQPRSPRSHTANANELAAHDAFIETLKKPVWRRN